MKGLQHLLRTANWNHPINHSPRSQRLKLTNLYEDATRFQCRLAFLILKNAICDCYWDCFLLEWWSIQAQHQSHAHLQVITGTNQNLNLWRKQKGENWGSLHHQTWSARFRIIGLKSPICSTTLSHLTGSCCLMIIWNLYHWLMHN